MTRKGRRMTLIAAVGVVLAAGVGLVLYGLRDNVVFFYTPQEVAQKGVAPGARLRLGGLVKPGSVVEGAGRALTFVIADTTNEISVSYTGLKPALFGEGKGVVAEGVLQTPTTFRADSVLAKHDEKYMPRELADSLKKQGVWQHGKDDGPAAQKPTP